MSTPNPNEEKINTEGKKGIFDASREYRKAREKDTINDLFRKEITEKSALIHETFQAILEATHERKLGPIPTLEMLISWIEGNEHGIEEEHLQLALQTTVQKLRSITEGDGDNSEELAQKLVQRMQQYTQDWINSGGPLNALPLIEEPGLPTDKEKAAEQKRKASMERAKRKAAEEKVRLVEDSAEREKELITQVGEAKLEGMKNATVLATEAGLVTGKLEVAEKYYEEMAGTLKQLLEDVRGDASAEKKVLLGKLSELEQLSGTQVEKILERMLVNESSVRKELLDYMQAREEQWGSERKELLDLVRELMQKLDNLPGPATTPEVTTPAPEVEVVETEAEAEAADEESEVEPEAETPAEEEEAPTPEPTAEDEENARIEELSQRDLEWLRDALKARRDDYATEIALTDKLVRERGREALSERLAPELRRRIEDYGDTSRTMRNLSEEIITVRTRQLEPIRRRIREEEGGPRERLWEIEGRRSSRVFDIGDLEQMSIDELRQEEVRINTQLDSLSDRHSHHEEVLREYTDPDSPRFIAETIRECEELLQRMEAEDDGIYITPGHRREMAKEEYDRVIFAMVRKMKRMENQQARVMRKKSRVRRFFGKILGREIEEGHITNETIFEEMIVNEREELMQAIIEKKAEMGDNRWKKFLVWWNKIDPTLRAVLAGLAFSAGIMTVAALSPMAIAGVLADGVAIGLVSKSLAVAAVRALGFSFIGRTVADIGGFLGFGQKGKERKARKEMVEQTLTEENFRELEQRYDEKMRDAERTGRNHGRIRLAAGILAAGIGVASNYIDLDLGGIGDSGDGEILTPDVFATEDVTSGEGVVRNLMQLKQELIDNNITAADVPNNEAIKELLAASDTSDFLDIAERMGGFDPDADMPGGDLKESFNLHVGDEFIADENGIHVIRDGQDIGGLNADGTVYQKLQGNMIDTYDASGRGGEAVSDSVVTEGATSADTDGAEAVIPTEGAAEAPASTEGFRRDSRGYFWDAEGHCWLDTHNDGIPDLDYGGISPDGWNHEGINAQTQTYFDRDGFTADGGQYHDGVDVLGYTQEEVIAMRQGIAAEYEWKVRYQEMEFYKSEELVPGKFIENIDEVRIEGEPEFSNAFETRIVGGGEIPLAKQSIGQFIDDGLADRISGSQGYIPQSEQLFENIKSFAESKSMDIGTPGGWSRFISNYANGNENLTVKQLILNIARNEAVGEIGVSEMDFINKKLISEVYTEEAISSALKDWKVSGSPSH